MSTVTITAQDINKLRQATGAGMMDCRKALTETNGDFEAAIDWLRKQPRVDGLTLIGHEPNLSQLAETLLCGSANGSMPLKKGGAILLRFAEGIAAGQGYLVWSLTPGILRTLAD